MFDKLKISILIFIFAPLAIVAQNCFVQVSGNIIDVTTKENIPYANIYFKELQVGAISDDYGHFLLDNICEGFYHISISHIGCETEELYIEVKSDTSLIIQLNHHSHLLDEIAIEDIQSGDNTQETQTLNSAIISENTDENLATMLEKITGVSTINNGSGISKPVVQGLYGNRLTILNNGVTQSGQQWGSDHSPEIDPLVANKLTVVKGVGVIEYQGNSLGGVIKVEPNKISKEPHVHGAVKYFFESNGLGNGINLQLEQYNKTLPWKFIGTVKRSGDNKTPDYFLNNTGNEEYNAVIQFEKDFGKKWKTDLYLSSFNAEYGLLRGGQIGNLTDLEAAFNRDEPFYTEENFSYAIDEPYQKTNHQLLKFHTKYAINSNQWIDVVYAGQYNLRKEFDVRRGNAADMPVLSLKQFTNYLDAKYQLYFNETWHLKTGVQFNKINNTNIPETGVLPLIPDYISTETGLFFTLSKETKHLTFDIGARYDYEFRNVATIEQTTREIVRYSTPYHNYSAITGLTYQFSHQLKLAYNIGFGQRNPEVNELYSYGLHQGVSGIEEGDPNLTKESSIKNSLSLKAEIKDKLFFESMIYYQNIDDYIYLNPTGEIRLTIRGAFPVFKYEQTHAQIYGLDLMATYQFSKEFYIVGKYSYLKGDDLTNDVPLVYMPSNNIYGEVNYHISTLFGLENIEFQLSNKYVFEQKNLLDSQDFVPPPPGYNLVGLKISSEKQFSKVRLKSFIKVDNLFNVAYRDYLNRQRYFADDLGINLIVGLNLNF